MKIHTYDDDYAGRNGVNGFREAVMIAIIAIVGLLIPVILFAIGVIPLGIMFVVLAIVIIAVIALRQRYAIFLKASMSSLIEDEGDLYYMMINPDLRGANIPKSFTAIMAGKRAVFAESAVEATAAATSMAQSKEIVGALFELFMTNKIETTFETFMYGKPVYIRKILDKDFNKESKKIYKVNCTIDGKNEKVKIPNAFPTFFTK